MPLPAPNQPWPPKEWKPVIDGITRWDAWWTGDTSKLWDAYHRSEPAPTPFRRGIRGMADRMFWGRRTSATPNRPSRGDLHVPMASDLCATSADLLYSTPPTIRGVPTKTMQRIEQYVDDGLWEQFLTGAEKGAALTGRYHRITFDPTLTPMPFISTVDADSALPEFRWGRLTAVTFWTVVSINGNQYRRHVERHELDAHGMGVTLHGLYEGTLDNLGRLVPLTEDPSTAPLAQVIREDHTLTSGTSLGLDVVYIPNITPNRGWRTDPKGKDLGRSDLDGIEPLMDALDEVYSSWMRDIRLGKARVFADRSLLLTDAAPGIQAPAFDLDQELFAPLEGLPGSLKDGGLPIQPQQFNIRVTEHEQTARALVDRIIRGARYSAATFGDDTGDTDVTATEVLARQAATNTTRDRKIRLEKPAVQRLLVKLLHTDALVFNTPGLDPEGLSVDFAPLVQQTTQGNAQTASTLRGAGLASLTVGVQMVHPDWDETSVKKEVEAILKEKPLTDPNQWDADPTRMPSELTQDSGDEDGRD